MFFFFFPSCVWEENRRFAGSMLGLNLVEQVCNFVLFFFFSIVYCQVGCIVFLKAVKLLFPPLLKRKFQPKEM